MSQGKQGTSRSTRETDGRNIDAGIGTLSGEASQQKVGSEIDPWKGMVPAVSGVPASRLPGNLVGDSTYYDRPVIKKSVWSWSIPLYYYVGGATGAAMALGGAATLLNRDELSDLVSRSRWIGVSGGTLSAALLIYDLGKPLRFLNMLRVFRPTSPMSMGSWILVSFSGSAFVSVVSEFGPAWMRDLGDTVAVIAGVLGLGLAGYTGVLVAHTTVPLWQRPHRLLPPLFLASGITGAASLFDILGGNRSEQKAVSVFGAAGKAAEIGFAHWIEKSVASVPEAARPFEEGLSGFVWKAAKFLTVASLVLSLIPNRNRGVRQAAGVLGTLGSLCTRFGIHYAGQKSALNPRATFHQQRKGQGAFAATGKAAITGPAGERAF